MRAIGDPASFLADPVGAYIDGTAFVLWAQHASRMGLFHTAGFVDHEDRMALLALAPLAASGALLPRYDALYDASVLEALDEAAFAFVDEFLRQYTPVLATRTHRVAVVRPRGYVGAAFTGLFERWVRPRLDARLCDSRQQAYDFLEVPGPDREVLDALASDSDPTLRALRDALAVDLVAATVERLAVRLGTSVRSLQRQMSAHGTSFRGELERARVHAVQARLIQTDDKLDAIAVDVGLGSASALVRLFERATGVAPGEFRRRAGERPGRP